MYLQRKGRYLYTTLLLSLALLLPTGLPAPSLHAAEPITLIIQLAPGTDPTAFGQAYQLTLQEEIPVLSAYLFQAAGATPLAPLTADPRVIAVQQDTHLTAFEAQQRPLGANEVEGLQRYFGFGNGDDEGEEQTQTQQTTKKIKKKKNPFTIDKPNAPEQVLVMQPGQKFEHTWANWGVRKIRLDKVFRDATGAGITVALLDTGVDLDHTLLLSRLTTGYDFVADDGWPDDEPNGIDDDEDGRTDEGSGHGTHIAGIIAMVAPAAKIMPVRVLNSDGGGTLFAIVQGLVYAVEQGADVVNMSFSAVDSSPLLNAAVQFALNRDVVLVAAAAGEDGYLEFPAAYDGVIAVGATKTDDAVTDFSQSYANEVDVFAPGEWIFSTYLNGGYAWWSGTSMAAPFVAGGAALLREQTACPQGWVMSILVNEISPVKPKLKDHGRINLEKALKKTKKACTLSAAADETTKQLFLPLIQSQ
ncbi:MAG: hypothetical protein DYG89_46970 [Caldilinea sp. CFX5]|nr:hypothetical protein [Caldilinea sp. CFX5]